MFRLAHFAKVILPQCREVLLVFTAAVGVGLITLFLASRPGCTTGDTAANRQDVANAQTKQHQPSAYGKENPKQFEATLRLENEKFMFVLKNAPKFAHALEQAPPRREDVLNKGSWVIVIAHPLSVPDLLAIKNASHVIFDFVQNGHDIQFGLRPFIKQEEMETWYPEYKENPITPIWVFLRSGKVIASERGTWGDDRVEFNSKNLAVWLEKCMGREKNDNAALLDVQ